MGQPLIAAVAITATLFCLATAAPTLAQGPQRPQPAPSQQEGQPQGQPQQQQAAPKPYKAVAVTPPAPMNDPSLEAFRKQVADIAEKKDRKALANMVSKSFFWIGVNGDQVDKKKSGIDNLAKAISLDAKDGSGWDTLIGFAADPTGMPLPERKDTICAPAEPDFDGKDLEALAKSTATEEFDWGYLTQQGIDMRASAQPNSAVVEKLGMHFIRVLEDDAAASGENPMIKVVAPSGKVGFVPIDAVSPLGSDSICYVKEGSSWKIAGFIGGEQ